MLTREPAMQVREHIVLDFQILNFVGLQKEMWQKGFFFLNDLFGTQDRH